MANEPTDVRPGPGELPATAYAVLGMLTLNDQELTAGEIRRRTDFGMRFFYWSPAVSHIRRELRRLLAMGFVEERELVDDRNRRAQVYSATPAGTEALAGWVDQGDLDETVVVKNSVLLRVYLGDLASPDRIIDVIESRIGQVDQGIDQLNWAIRRTRELGADAGDAARFPILVAGYNLRSLHFERSNLVQLRDQIVGLDAEAFSQDTSIERSVMRHRRRPDQA